MSIENDLHPVQAKILRELLFKPLARFSQLNLTGLTNDHFTFHINKLIEVGLIEKVGKEYTLTTKGKEFANRLDTDTTTIERQAKTAVLVIGVRKSKSKVEYLIQQRLKQPFYGYYGFVTGKVRWGEKILETAKRELNEETGYTSAKFSLVGIEHKMDIKDNRVQEDKYFYVVKASDPEGKLVENFEGGKNSWMTEVEFDKLDNKFDDIDNLLSLAKRNRTSVFSEKMYVVKQY